MPKTTTVNISGIGMSSGLPDGMENNSNQGVVDVTASTLALTRVTHGGRIVTLARAAGQAVTLPAATGSGVKYELIIRTSITSNTTTITCAGSDKLQGVAWVFSDNAAAAVIAFAAVSGTSVIATFNGTTQGGLSGQRILLTDIAAARWQIDSFSAATGTEATPFS